METDLEATEEILTIVPPLTGVAGRERKGIPLPGKTGQTRMAETATTVHLVEGGGECVCVCVCVCVRVRVRVRVCVCVCVRVSTGEGGMGRGEEGVCVCV